MTKTQEEIDEYILNYKNDLLHSKDAEKARTFDRANDADDRLVTQLILTSTVLLTVIGGLIATSQRISNDGIKVLLTLAIISLLVSICSGLIHFIFVGRFFANWGKHLHRQGRLISRDKSNNIDDLEKLLEKLQESSDAMPIKSSSLFSLLQGFTFITGVILVLVVVTIKIYT